MNDVIFAMPKLAGLLLLVLLLSGMAALGWYAMGVIFTGVMQ